MNSESNHTGQLIIPITESQFFGFQNLANKTGLHISQWASNQLDEVVKRNQELELEFSADSFQKLLNSICENTNRLNWTSSNWVKFKFTGDLDDREHIAK